MSHWINPCGCWTDILRTFYRMPCIVLVGGVEYQTWIKYYRAPPGAKKLPYRSVFFHGQFHGPNLKPYPVGETGRPRIWSRGQNPGYKGIAPVGLEEWYETGSLPAYVLTDPIPPLPSDCCQPPARLGGGLVIGGSAIASPQPPKGKGGLVIGGKAVALGGLPAKGAGGLVIGGVGRATMATGPAPSGYSSGSSGSGGGGGGETFGCSVCPDGAAAVWRLVVTGMTGNLSSLNGTYDLTEFGASCVWQAPVPGGGTWSLVVGSMSSQLTGANGLSSVTYQNPASVPGSQLFTSSGTWTAPAGVTSVDAYLIGGGGGAGGDAYISSGGGGGGGSDVLLNHAVVPGNNYAVVVGAGGAGGSNIDDGLVGGGSTFDGAGNAPGGGGGGGGYLVAPGGAGGVGGAYTGGVGGGGNSASGNGNGGSGGGGAGDAGPGGAGVDDQVNCTLTAGGAGGASSVGQPGGAGGLSGDCHATAGGGGNAPGGGGGGAGVTHYYAAPNGDGGAGQVYLKWTAPGPQFACLGHSDFDFVSQTGTGGHPSTLGIDPGP